jgi:hypothetical protein
MVTEYLNFDEWAEAAANEGAGLIIEEIGEGLFGHFYACLPGREKIVGHFVKNNWVGHVYSSAMNFSTRRRKFDQIRKMFAVNPNVIENISSDGRTTYFTKKDGSSCTCPGFTYRNDCKHVKAARGES